MSGWRMRGAGDVLLARVRAFFCSENVSGWQAAAVFAVFIAAHYLTAKPPQDDGLRHLVSYLYDYDLRKLFPYSYYPAFDPYWLFDWVVGKLHAVMGFNSFTVLQLVAFALFSLGFWLMTAGTSNSLRLALLFVTFGMVRERLFLVRPCTFELAFFLIAMGCARRENVPSWVHFLLGCIMASFYNLFWIYLIPLAFARRVYVWPLVLAVPAWYLYAGVDYFKEILYIATTTGKRLMPLGEAQSILLVFFLFPYAFVCMGQYWRCDARTALVTGWFFLLNKVRFLEVVVPLAMSYGRFLPFRPNRVVLLVAFLFSFHSTVTAHSGKNPARFSGMFPAGSSVFNVSGDAHFSIAYTNPGVMVIPNTDPGWNDFGLQRAMAQGIKEGTFDCSVLDNYRIDYIVESSLRTIPDCLVLSGVVPGKGGDRVWVPGVKKTTSVSVFNLARPPQ